MVNNSVTNNSGIPGLISFLKLHSQVYMVDYLAKFTHYINLNEAEMRVNFFLSCARLSVINECTSDDENSRKKLKTTLNNS